LSPDQELRESPRGSVAAQGHQNVAEIANAATNHLPPPQGYVIGINDCKQRACCTGVIRAADSPERR
jgi:hypothetical protein